MNDRDLIGRRRPAHLPAIERHNTPVILLVTVCTKDRLPILANGAMFRILCEVWKTGAVAWSAGRFVLMPDHLHVFCAPATVPARPVGDWVRYWKRLAGIRSREASEGGEKSARGAARPPRSMWQQDYWDRQLRTGEHYHDRWEYVRQNPVRAGLVAEADLWPWQGEVNVLRW